MANKKKVRSHFKRERDLLSIILDYSFLVFLFMAILFSIYELAPYQRQQRRLKAKAAANSISQSENLSSHQANVDKPIDESGHIETVDTNPQVALSIDKDDDLNLLFNLKNQTTAHSIDSKEINQLAEAAIKRGDISEAERQAYEDQLRAEGFISLMNGAEELDEF
jgi:hypothetical protein